ncbi:MAG: primosomal protein N' [Jatrophihabitans sp.]
MVDTPLAHLDRPFDYLVPAAMCESVTAGSRVRVRFSGRLVDGYVLGVSEQTEHVGKLAELQRVIGAEPVLTEETAGLFRAVADRWAGTFADVVRLGVPGRHARAESARWERLPVEPAGDSPGWATYRAGPAFLTAVADRRSARAVWSALPGEDWPARFAEAAHVAAAAGRGAVLVVPDARDLARLDAAMTAEMGAGRHVALSAELGPEARYRRWLAARRGDVAVVIGTRSATLAPVPDLGLVAIWDDGDDLHEELRAPYPHARDLLVLRASRTGAAVLVGGHARTAEAQLLVESGWAREIAADRPALRERVPRIVAVGDDVEQSRDPAATAARLPSIAWRTARETLTAGRPVLVQVPRRGYAPSLACIRDRTPARCATCSGPLAATSGHAIATCRWCARPAADWACPGCGGRRMRAVVIGAGRTAEELGRAFPGVALRLSGGSTVLAEVPAEPALVVATPGAEPVPADGYGAALLLDGWALLSRPDLRAGEETLRRWANAVALVRADGTVIVGADAGVPAVQALIRWDPAGHASRELADRAELRFPPTVRMASVTGAAAAVAEMTAQLQLPEPHEVIGPIPAKDDAERLLIRVPRSSGAELAVSLKAAQAARSARKATDPVRVQLDPSELF